jgi:hypothetical protein
MPMSIFIMQGGEKNMIQSIKSLISRLYQDTGIRVIQANQTASQPPLPYGVYNITSPYIKGVGREDVSTFEDETGLYLKRTEQYKVTISFNLYAKDNETTIDLASQVRKWFLFMGEEFIQEQNIAIVEVGNTENRTTFLVDSYEYKHGFDVQLRLSEELIKAVGYFDRIEGV